MDEQKYILLLLLFRDNLFIGIVYVQVLALLSLKILIHYTTLQSS